MKRKAKTIVLTFLLLFSAAFSACQNGGGTDQNESSGTESSAVETQTGGGSETAAPETETESGQAAKDYSDEIDVVQQSLNYERSLIHAEVPDHLTEQPSYVLQTRRKRMPGQ